MRQFDSIVGGKWWKVDFHVHSPGSYDYGHGDDHQKQIPPEDYLQACMNAELDCIVVTDHNSFDWIPKLKETLEEIKSKQVDYYRDIIIFPGIEINVQGNVHLLGIFDPQTDYNTLVSIPALVGYDAETETTEKSINEVINIIVKKNGIAIPAHVDAQSGLFESGSPSIIKQALRTEQLLALEVVGDREIKNALLRESKQKLSYIVGSDSHTTDTIGRRFTWVKMGTPSIEALRLALFDTGDGAIRDIEISGNPNESHGKSYLKSIEIRNGRYIGRKEPYVANYSPWLNSIIGGRGSGKSTILNFIRMVLDRGDELPETLKGEYKEFIKSPKNRSDSGMIMEKKGDNSGTIIKLEMCVEGVDYCLKWEDGEIKEYNEDAGLWEEARSVRERFPIRLFSQKQLLEMTNDTKLLFKYLDEQWDYEKWEEKYEQLRFDYFETARKKCALVERKNKAQELEIQLRDVERKISAFETETAKNALARKEALKVQSDAIRNIYSQYEGFIQWANNFSDYECIEATDIDNSELDEETATELRKWEEGIVETLKKIKNVLSKNREHFLSLDSLYDLLSITERIRKNKEEMEKVISELEDAGVDDIELYAGFIDEKEDVEKELSALGNVDKEIENCNQEMAAQKERWCELVKNRLSNRERVLDCWNEIGALRISLIPFGNLQTNDEEFRRIIRRVDASFEREILEYDEDGNPTGEGILFFLSEESDIESKIASLINMKKIVGDASTAQKKFDNYLSRMFVDAPECKNELEMWLPNDALKLEIKANNSGRTTYKAIEVGSPGQKTAAILSLILGISSMPIIIDQPEDDLDTRNITDIVVAGMAKMKQKQQIIVVTHNPNIVVNSNSEEVIQLDYYNGQIQNVCSGALQNHDVRDAICEVMEGGKDALEKRYYRIFKALED